MSDTKLYAFQNLEQKLKDMGIKIRIKKKKEGLISTDIEDLIRMGKIEFTPRGMIVEDINGDRHYAYYHLSEYTPSYDNGKRIYPKAHITECGITNRYRENGMFDDKYTVSYSKLAKIKNKRTGKYEKKKLETCKKCLKKLSIDDTIDDTEKLTEILSKIPDTDGYTLDWKGISQRYRMQKGWKCEKCGIDLSKHHDLLDVHHINMVKTDNRDENLMALCVECHANINERHKQNFYKPTNYEADFRLEKLKEVKKNIK